MESFFTSTKGAPAKVPMFLVAQCGACGLATKCKSPKMPVVGKGNKGILVVGEAPGCISGDSLIDTAFRDKSKHPNGIPIRDLVGVENLHVYSFDIISQQLVVGKVNKVWTTGKKKVFRVTYDWGVSNNSDRSRLRNSVVVTANHPFLLKKVREDQPDYLSIEQGLKVGDSLQPFHRHYGKNYAYVGIKCKSTVREARFLLQYKTSRPLERLSPTIIEECHHRDENKVNDTWDNLELLTTDRHSYLHIKKVNPLDRPGARDKRSVSIAKRHEEQARLKQLKLRMKETSEENFRKPEFYYKFLLGIQKHQGWLDEEVKRRFKEKFPDEDLPLDNHRVVSIEELGFEDVYDMEVESYHNFAVNGIFLHNSDEDDQNKPFVGKSGRFLRDKFRKYGVDLWDDCWVTNSVICRPKNNELPTKAVDYCRPNLIRAVRDLNPKVIITLGGSAVQGLLGWLWKEEVGGVNRWVGFKIPCISLNSWVCPTWHPSYLLREDNACLDMLFSRHIEQALALKSRPWEDPLPNYPSMVKVIYEDDKAANAIYDMLDLGTPVAIDIETDRLKPHREDSWICSCALSNGETTISFPWMGNAIDAVKELITNPIPKIGWNIRFESLWMKVKLGVWVRNWAWDGMIAAHILDNRPGIKSLKFQVFVHLGVGSYDDHIKPYLKSDGSNLPNKIRDLPLRDVLQYGAVDALCEFDMAQIQSRQLGIEL